MARAFSASRGDRWRQLLLLTSLAACTEPQSPASPDPELGKNGSTTSTVTVTSTDPPSSARDTTLDVRVLGDGFDRGSSVAFALDGVVDPKLRVNSTRYRKSTELVANVTIAADASVDTFDVVVTTSTGKKGIGTEMFEVLSIMELGTPSGGYSYGRDVNSAGTVVGEYQVAGTTCKRAYVWTEPTGAVDLPQSNSGCTVFAVAVNEGGIIVGYGSNPGYEVLRWLPSGSATWVLDVLPTLPGLTRGQGKDIAEDGAILAGFHTLADEHLPFIWTDASGWTAVTPPGSPADCWKDYTGINRAGQVVGADCNGALFWPSPTSAPVYLPIPSGYHEASATDVNDAGIVVGRAEPISTGVGVAVRWVPDGGGGWRYEELGTLAGRSAARAINGAGMIVGESGSGEIHAFIWEPLSGMRDLGTLKNQSSGAVGISEVRLDGSLFASGWSVSQARGSYQRAVRWIP